MIKDKKKDIDRYDQRALQILNCKTISKKKINYFFISSNFNLIKKNFENPILQDMFNHKLNYQSILERIRSDLKN